MAKVKILVVDDEQGIRDLFTVILEDQYQVLTTDNGEKALKIIKEENPDIVFLDLKLPGMDGIEALGQIKETNPSIIVIMITGHGTVEKAVESMDLGAYEYIVKPLNVKEVEALIRQALRMSGLEQEVISLRKKMEKKQSEKMERKYKLLVVDDEIGVRDLIKTAFGSDYEVFTAESAEAGFDIVKAENPDLIFLDIKLPGIDGIEALGRIKKMDEKVIVIMITAFGGEKDAIKCMKMGAAAYVNKPFDVSYITMLVQNFLP